MNGGMTRYGNETSDGMDAMSDKIGLEAFANPIG